MRTHDHVAGGVGACEVRHGDERAVNPQLVSQGVGRVHVKSLRGVVGAREKKRRSLGGKKPHGERALGQCLPRGKGARAGLAPGCLGLGDGGAAAQEGLDVKIDGTHRAGGKRQEGSRGCQCGHAGAGGGPWGGV